jgi:hypothetical protein
MRLALLTFTLLLLSTVALAASDLRVEARFAPAKGLISDAALLGNGDVLLAYPQDSYLADYSPDGKLVRHVIRENGLQVRFHPTMLCALRKKNTDKDSEKSAGVIVFDEAERHVFRVALDGNFSKGIDLGVIEAADDPPISAARIGALSIAGDGSLWAMLAGKDWLTHFDERGKQLGHVDLADELGSRGVYARAQVLADGTLYLLDYSQGAIMYRPPGQPKFRRVKVSDPHGAFETQPAVQDFAALDDGTLLVATTDDRRPLLLLSPAANGRTSRPIALQLGDARRLSVRASRGKFIVWASDSPVVFVLSP